MRQEIEEVIAGVCKNLFGVEDSIELTRPEEQFGDYATNIALRLAKQLGKNPRDIAEAIKSGLSSDYISEATIAGPGFLNIRLTDKTLTQLASEGYQPRRHDKVVIETNNPNPFKPMHIGHAYNAIVADTIANLLDNSGAETHRVSYHGDIGAHVGRSMWSILTWLDGDFDKLAAVKPADRNTFMADHYKRGTSAYKEDQTVRQAIDDLAVQSFTQTDALFKKVYQTCFDWSFEDLGESLARIGNKPTEKRYLESQADELGVQTVKKHVGTVFEVSDGALIFHGEQHGSFTNVFVSANGRGLYAARDLGLMQLKDRDYKAQKSYIVTAEEQKSYFIGVIAAAEQCLPQLKGVTTNISTGTVKLSTGKMSSRTGDVLDIAWLFNQIEQATAAQGSTNDQILIGAIRYEFLKARIGSDVIFDVGESVSLKGNTGPYLQYAHARACSILAKAEAKETVIHDLQPAERSLMRKIGEYNEAVDRAITELMPHHVCTYLYELAQVFNSFYEHNRVLGSDREAQRLTLVSKYTKTLKAGLGLLGISAPEKM